MLNGNSCHPPVITMTLPMRLHVIVRGKTTRTPGLWHTAALGFGSIDPTAVPRGGDDGFGGDEKKPNVSGAIDFGIM